MTGSSVCGHFQTDQDKERCIAWINLSAFSPLTFATSGKFLDRIMHDEDIRNAFREA
jgi:hypothetical protein